MGTSILIWTPPGCPSVAILQIKLETLTMLHPAFGEKHTSCTLLEGLPFFSLWIGTCLYLPIGPSTPYGGKCDSEICGHAAFRTSSLNMHTLWILTHRKMFLFVL